MIRLKTLLEQMFPMLGTNNAARINLQKGGGFSGKTPGTEMDAPDAAMLQLANKSPRELVASTFTAARKLNKPATAASNSIAKTMHANISRAGSGALLRLLRAVRDINALSSIITSYYKLYNNALYNDIANEWTTSWDKLWDSCKHLNPSTSRYHHVKLPEL
jgi:hypothetical protein